MTSTDNSFKAARTKSTTTFLSALIISASVAGIQLLIFLILRTSIKKIYSPRTYLPHPSKRSQSVSSAPWGWLLPTIRAPSLSMIPTAGLDAYMYLRFLKMMVYIFGPTTCLTSAVLLPLNAVGTSFSSSGLNSFAFGNIPESQQIRYVGHLLCAYAVTIWVIYLIQKEMSGYIYLRQKFLTSQNHIDLPQSRTVLVTGVPKQFLSAQALKQLTAKLPGGIKQVWISRDLKNLPQLYNDRLKYTAMLESAETKLCKAAVQRNKKITSRVLPSSGSKNSALSLSKELREEFSKEVDPTESDPVNELVHRKARPTHRLGFLGLFGRKVDTVDWCKDQIVRLTKEIDAERKKHDQHHPHNSAFIEFNDRLAAQIFSQIVLYQKPLRMAKRYVDAAPEDIIWDNLNINPYDERVRNMISWVLTMGLVVLWSFPVAFIGSLSNITYLCTTIKWLSWLCHTKSRLQDIIQGILPPVLLALIFLILPMLLRLIGRYSGVPRISEIELILMTRYYIFLVIHGFVVTTLSSGLTAAIPALSKDPGQAVTILSENLPKASIFFMTYMITTSLTSAAGSLLQVFDLILYYLKLSVFASTPRSVFNIRYTMSRPMFGTLFPNTTLLATIGLAYSIIAPIMSILALLAFSLYWLVYKYLFLFAFDIPAAHETGGRFFPLAMNHLFIGLYFSQICLTGLFFLARNTHDQPSSIPQGAMMVVLIFGTFFCHLLIRNSYAPLTMFVPLNMIEESSSEKCIDEGKDEEEGLLRKRPLSEIDIDYSSQQSDKGEDRKDDRRWSSRALPEGVVSSGSNPKLISKQHPTPPRRDSRPLESVGLRSGAEIKIHDPINDQSSSPDHFLPRPIHMNIRRPSDRSIGEVEIFPEQGRTAFLHPAVWENIRPIWVPEDPVGLASLEVADMRRRKIPASLLGAGISPSGKVFVTRSPPEDAQVVEFQRGKVEGIFALPGAIGGVARAAGGMIGGKVMNSTVKSNATAHARKTSGASSDDTPQPRMSTASRHYLGGSLRNPLLASIRRKAAKNRNLVEEQDLTEDPLGGNRMDKIQRKSDEADLMSSRRLEESKEEETGEITEEGTTSLLDIGWNVTESDRIANLVVNEHDDDNRLKIQGQSNEINHD